MHELAFWSLFPVEGCFARASMWGEGLGPASTPYARLCGLCGLTHSEKWIRGWVEEGGQGRRRRGREKCGWYVK